MQGTGRPKHLPVLLLSPATLRGNNSWPPVPLGSPLSVFLLLRDGLREIRHSGRESSWKMKASGQVGTFDEIIVLKEKVAALETWRASTEVDLKEIHDVVSQVKLLMSLSIGGGGLSLLTLAVTLILLVTGQR
jgi:hypothetical protein